MNRYICSLASLLSLIPVFAGCDDDRKVEVAAKPPASAAEVPRGSTSIIPVWEQIGTRRGELRRADKQIERFAADNQFRYPQLAKTAEEILAIRVQSRDKIDEKILAEHSEEGKRYFQQKQDIKKLVDRLTEEIDKTTEAQTVQQLRNERKSLWKRLTDLGKTRKALIREVNQDPGLNELRKQREDELAPLLQRLREQVASTGTEGAAMVARREEISKQLDSLIALN